MPRYRTAQYLPHQRVKAIAQTVARGDEGQQKETEGESRNDNQVGKEAHNGQALFYQAPQLGMGGWMPKPT